MQATPTIVAVPSPTGDAATAAATRTAPATETRVLALSPTVVSATAVAATPTAAVAAPPTATLGATAPPTPGTGGTPGATGASPTEDTSLGPTPTYAPEADWPTDAPPTPFAPPQPIAEAATLAVPEAPPLTTFAAALRAEAQGDLAGQEGRSLYQMALRLDPAGQQLFGHERVTLTNGQDAPLREVVFRLYPNFPGVFDERRSPTGFPRLQVGAARVGNAPAEVRYLAGNTAAAVVLPEPIPPGAQQTVDLEFRLSTQGLGPAPDLWYFKSFYPLLAVYDRDGWRLDVTAFPDQVFAESSFYVVDWSVPVGVVLASSGTETTDTASDGLDRHHIVAGPVREFAATASPRYRQDTLQVDDITVRSTALITDTEQATVDLDIAAKSLEVYNTLIGAYPFNELDMVLTPGGGGGIEFPGYVMISHLRAGNYLREHVVSHEVAHQWWYSLVGDDIYREPWLDESFADYTTYLYLQRTAGQTIANQVFQQQTAGGWPGYSGKVETADPTNGKRVGSAIWEFENFEEYDGIIYGKGPVFLERLRRLLGDDAFFRLLKTHYARNKYGVTTGRIFLAEALDVAGAKAPEVRELYQAWIEGR
ncbi:MAG TPA: M1 family metallopeptidase [Chloroflexia bacterium]|nr:M1 family metallopeptidase [Chloroflexia bacterium]